MRTRTKILIGIGVFVLLALIAGFIALNQMLPTAIPVPEPPDRTAEIAPPAPLPPDARAEILWDVWGVPHIYSNDNESAFYAYGWSQAHNHGDLLLTLYAQARGQASAYFGAEHLEADRVTLTFGIPELGEEMYAAQSPEFARYIDAFVAGINDYAGENPDAFAEEAQGVLPVTGADVTSHMVRIFLLFQTNSAGITFVPGLDLLADPSIGIGPSGVLLGSNGWAIAPARTAGDNALLLANPHLVWGGWMTWFEAQVVTPEVNLYGASLVGSPVINIAFNDYLGWTHTVNTIDAVDVYTLETVGEGYRFDGEMRDFATEMRTLSVRQEDGSLADEEMVIRRTVHGPVFEADGELLAVRASALVAPVHGALEQWWEMGKATNLEAFEAALQRMQLPMMNVIYADRDGHILELFAGQVPERPAGDADFWAGRVDGGTSETLWSDALAYEALPKVIDPESGFVQNSNSAPWWMAGPGSLNPEDYLPYVAPAGPVNLREQRGLQMLMGDESISFAELLAYKHDTYALLSERVLDDLIAAAQASDDEDALAAAEILTAWDRRYQIESEGAMLFYVWGLTFRQPEDQSEFAVEWDPEAPLDTPAGLADPDAAVATLVDVYNQLRPLPVLPQANLTDRDWGYLARFRFGDVDLPGNGASGTLGVFRVAEFYPGEQGYMTAVAGDTYIAAVEFTENGPRAEVLITYGNSTQPGSPHAGDQLWLAMERELRPAWLERAEVAEHLEDYVLFE